MMKFLSYVDSDVHSFGVMSSAAHRVDLPIAARLFTSAPGLDSANPFPQTLDEALRTWDNVQRAGKQCLSLVGSSGKTEKEAVVIRLAELKIDAPVRHPSKIGELRSRVETFRAELATPGR